MRWVKETFPPRLRERWLLMTMRLSINSLAGMARRLVAVGTSRLDSMLVTVRAVAPRSRVTWASVCGLGALRAGASRGVGEGLRVGSFAAVPGFFSDDGAPCSSDDGAAFFSDEGLGCSELLASAVFGVASFAVVLADSVGCGFCWAASDVA